MSYKVSSGTVSAEGYAPCYDGNGNVMALVTLSSGELVGQYEYGAFGETVSMDGDWVAQENPVRFSTKYLDGETGLYNYGYRLYDPLNARWLSKDPSEEHGGSNLYGMCGNDAVNSIDYLGLSDLSEYLYATESLTILQAAAAAWVVYPTASKCLGRYLNRTGGVMDLDASTHSNLHKNAKFNQIYSYAIQEMVANKYSGKTGSFNIDIEGTTQYRVGFARSDGDLFYAFHNIYLKPRLKGKLCITGTKWTFLAVLGRRFGTTLIFQTQVMAPENHLHQLSGFLTDINT